MSNNLVKYVIEKYSFLIFFNRCSEDSSSTDTESSSQQSHSGNDFVMVEKHDAQDT